MEARGVSGAPEVYHEGMETSSHQSQLQGLADSEVLGLALTSGNLTNEGRAHLAEEITRRGLPPGVANALRGPDSEWPQARRDALVERTRARRCPLCTESWAALDAKVVNRNEQALLAMLSSVALAALIQEPDGTQFTIVACPSCLGVGPPPSQPGPASKALIEFVIAHRHLLETFDDRPDVIDAILRRDPEDLAARLTAPMDPEWRLEHQHEAPSRTMVAVEELDSRSDALEAMHLLNAANLEAHVHEMLRDGETVFEVLVPQMHINLAKACLSAAADSDDAEEGLDFCFHCGSGIEAGAERCPDCGGDLSDQDAPAQASESAE